MSKLPREALRKGSAGTGSIDQLPASSGSDQPGPRIDAITPPILLAQAPTRDTPRVVCSTIRLIRKSSDVPKLVDQMVLCDLREVDVPLALAIELEKAAGPLGKC
jgi:hypothetical protein